MIRLSIKDCEFVIAIVSQRTRMTVFNRVKKLGKAAFAKLIYPSVRYSKFVEMLMER